LHPLVRKTKTPLKIFSGGALFFALYIPTVVLLEKLYPDLQDLNRDVTRALEIFLMVAYMASFTVINNKINALYKIEQKNTNIS